MTVRLAILKCKVCGNIVEVLHTGAGTIICCGEPMEMLAEKTADVGMEKHVPVIEKTANGFKIKVGSVPHPMEEKHYIEWIELIANGRTYRKFLKPGDLPEAEFCVEANAVTAREYCNVHGLWKSK
ncbi:MAG: desulfoferrodoxin [candidate division WOR-3 bacterium]|nr:desulfoferrodoxin [candidate division WOR-3 bacterium]MCX7757019.1 desulfoferrodoxin [candidate division WOR-3 bacterium]MDW7987323.1 desulfoferrodoxin [candidate division WOR-3 bacterium]